MAEIAGAATIAGASTRTVDRALALLAEVSTSGPLTLSDCARRTDLPASTALRLLRTLESSGFVERDRDGAFRAGTTMIRLGAGVLSRQSLVHLAQGGLGRIVAATGESTYLGIAGPGSSVVYVSIVEGTHAVRHASWVGRTFPSRGLAIGCALSGDVPAAGYVARRDVSEPDVTGIAAPILWPGGVAGALNLVGPTYRLDEPTTAAYGAIVSAEARAITALLGGSPALREVAI